ncbi:MAG TPA: type IV toxin-antitoxin system AbiEi family antitoxin domain-containing protein [Lapillicoccus sp.]|uniref:type IV toxin-antitoxin system AbiEi family antitoxin domain-containing protein n=1 Tax=Lapillicoccus sp. TaxID=1909287 RepID=UPI002F91DC29
MTDPDIFGPPLGAPPVPHDLEALMAVVAQQRGLVTRAQSLSAGLSDRAIGHRLRTQRWVSVRRGVYLTVPLGREQAGAGREQAGGGPGAGRGRRVRCGRSPGRRR